MQSNIYPTEYIPRYFLKNVFVLSFTGANESFFTQDVRRNNIANKVGADTGMESIIMSYKNRISKGNVHKPCWKDKFWSLNHNWVLDWVVYESNLHCYYLSYVSLY